MDKLSGILPFLALGAVGVANLVAAVGALRGAHRTEELGEERSELLRDQHERLELLREERRMLLDELERERERLARSGDQQNVQRLELDLQELQQLLDVRQQALKAPKKGLWTNLLRSNNH